MTMNNEELREALRAKQAAINDAINELQFYRRVVSDLLAVAKARRVASIKVLADSAGVDATTWTGLES